MYNREVPVLLLTFYQLYVVSYFIPEIPHAYLTRVKCTQEFVKADRIMCVYALVNKF